MDSGKLTSASWNIEDPNTTHLCLNKDLTFPNITTACPNPNLDSQTLSSCLLPSVWPKRDSENTPITKLHVTEQHPSDGETQPHKCAKDWNHRVTRRDKRRNLCHVLQRNCFQEIQLRNKPSSVPSCKNSHFLKNLRTPSAVWAKTSSG